jgi:PBP1b-binding outer membrane lipoprotein LpoB
MKNKKYLSITLVIVLMLVLSACSNKTAKVDKTESVDASIPVAKTEHADKTEPVDKTATSSKPTGQIYLYGEQHGVEKILDKELELWCDYYNKKNMRHLFIIKPPILENKI